MVYRSRSTKGLDKDMLNFLSSVESDGCILYYDVLGSEAHSIMLYEIGILSFSELKKILTALEEIRKNPAVLDTSDFEDIHECVEATVMKLAGMKAGGKMHTARSRNDQVVLDIHMKIRDDINKICTSVLNLIDSLLKKTKNKSIMIMYTHLQQGQIGTFSHFLLSYVASLFRDMDRLYGTYERINRSPLGACAIGGSSINIDRHMTYNLLGFDGVITNSIDATSSRDVLIEFTANLSIMMSSLSRMAEDFIIWSTSEFGYIEISDEYASTSSVMPQKKNADPLELIRSKSAQVSGSLVSMLTTVKSLPSGYSRDLQDLKPALWSSSNTTVKVLQMMTLVVNSLVIHEEKMREMALNSYAISVDIAEQLVVRKGMPFRSTHKVVGSLVKEAAATGKTSLNLLGQEDIENVLKKIECNMEPIELLKIIEELTPERSLQLRRSEGSPNIEEQQKTIDYYNLKLSECFEQIKNRKHYLSERINNLLKIIQNYLNQDERIH